jgi:hypothetical protein
LFRFEFERSPQHLFAELSTLLLVLGWNARPDVATREGKAVLI